MIVQPAIGTGLEAAVHAAIERQVRQEFQLGRDFADAASRIL